MCFWLYCILSKSQQNASSHQESLSTELKFVLNFLGIAFFEMFSILVFSLPHIASVNKQACQRIKTQEGGENHHNLLNLFLLILQCSLEDRLVRFFFKWSKYLQK